MNGIKDWKKDDAFASGKHVICGESTGIQARDKYLLSLVEASDYFNIGINRLRRIAENHLGLFSVMVGNRYLIVRKRFEDFIDQTTSL
jgi:hypothetical protein